MRNKKSIFILSALLIVALGAGIYYAVTIYRMNLIPSMSFEEMMDYTTKNNERAIITVELLMVRIQVSRFMVKTQVFYQ